MTRARFMGAAKKKTPVIVAGGEQGYIVRSEDGVNWSGSRLASSDVRQIIRANGLFISVGAGGVHSSPDGITWTSRASGILNSVAYGGGVFCAMGDVFLTSPDGITWTNRPLVSYLSNNVNTVMSVSYNAGLWVCICATSAGTTRSFIKSGSPTSAWTMSGTLFGVDAYFPMKPHDGIFYVMRQNASGQIYKSSDGVSFSSVGIASASSAGAGWAYSGSLWVAVGSNGTTPFLKTSGDLSSWTTVSTTFFTSAVIATVEWVPGLNLWVIGGLGGLIAYSPDATNWTLASVNGLGTRYIQAFAYGYV
ncbi:hypothetical protein CHELA1G11_11239 [Hyphomicrobiales bacterium]|nr:hypothetical protein CHELA1G11_11239 [Hyphomicrobiales bacterium]CAH1669160.1 hypothetical protein CHELA1G2_13070 [Hyphomicrobiales bacterium]